MATKKKAKAAAKKSAAKSFKESREVQAEESRGEA